MAAVHARTSSAGRRVVAAVVVACVVACGLAWAPAAGAQPTPQAAPPPAPQTAPRPAVIVGRVLDAADRPLGGATVALEGFEVEVRTGADGRFAFDVDFVPDEVVAFRHVGYAPARTAVHLARGDTLRLVARLARVGVLDTVRTVAAAPTTSARLTEFETRRARGRGVFVTRAEIERRVPASATDLLRWTGAVRIVDSLGVLLPASVRGGRWNAQRRQFDPNCIMRMAVDGVLMPQLFSLHELPAPAEIAGVEIYKGGATIPVELSGARADNYCGLIVVWTRAR